MSSARDYYKSQNIRRVVCITVLNENSVLSRISGLFSARGYNIDSLTVAPIPQSEYSNITIVTNGNERVINQIIKQIHKLIPVLKVNEHKDIIQKDTVLIKLPISSHLGEIDVLARSYNGSIQNVTSTCIILAATDDPQRIANFIKVMQNYKPIEIIRSGVVAMQRDD